MGRTYRYNKDGENEKYKKDRYLLEQKKKQKRRIEADSPDKNEKQRKRRGDEDE